MTLNVRPAEPGDVDAVADILAEASAWLATKGIAQWPPRFSADFLLGYVRRRELYVADAAAEVAATVTLQWTDPAFWGDRQDAAFVHRLAVRRAYAGRGGELLRWAEAEAMRGGRRFLCLDTLSSNTRLRDYYESIGFRAVGEIDGPVAHPTDPALGAWRAVLFEKPLGPSPG